MKSQVHWADARGMVVLMVTGLVAAAFVLMALGVVASDIDYSQRCHTLREEARVLRDKQLERLRNLRPQRR